MAKAGNSVTYSGKSTFARLEHRLFLPPKTSSYGIPLQHLIIKGNDYVKSRWEVVGVGSICPESNQI